MPAGSGPDDEIDDRLEGPTTWTADPWERAVREVLERMDAEVSTVVVEGPRDRAALRTAGVESPIRTCAQSDGLVPFAASLPDGPIAILTDYDTAGRQLNGRLRELVHDGRVESRWRRELGLLLTQRGRYDVESLNNVFDGCPPLSRR